MSQLIQTNNQSLPSVIASIPQWIHEFKSRENHTRYSREGMKDFVIPASPVRLDEKAHQQAKEALDYLLKLSSIPLSLDIVRETFKLVNGIIANPLSADVFNFKVSAIYSVFAKYPASIFNEETARNLATLNKFFPSGNEIEQVLKEANDQLNAEIANLQSVVGYGFHTKEDQIREEMEVQAKRRERQKQKEDEERQYRINRLKAKLKPIDDLIVEIQEAVEKYVPKNGFNMDHDALVNVLTQQMNAVDDAQIKAILQEKINTIRSAQRQFEQLMQVGIIKPQREVA